MGSHVPRLAMFPCKERVESSILFGSTKHKRPLSIKADYTCVVYRRCWFDSDRGLKNGEFVQWSKTPDR